MANNEVFLFLCAGVLILFTSQSVCEPDGNSLKDTPVIRIGNHSQHDLAIISKNIRDSLEYRRRIQMQSSPRESLESFDNGIFVHGTRTDEETKTHLEDDGNAVVELALVCDMEFGAVFDFNEEAIRDYLTVFFWDSALRFKSLPNSNVSLHIALIVIITEPSEQPFIEDTRDEFGFITPRVHDTLHLFSKYVYEMIPSWPKFDVAVAVTNAVERDLLVGDSNIGGACFSNYSEGKYYGTALFADRGTFLVKVATHEIGHVLGALHDTEEDFPGGCVDKDRSYIMSTNVTRDKQFYFSSCSDRLIGEFVRSKEGSCLRHINNGDGGLKNLPAPSRLDQCIRFTGRTDVFVDESESDICSVSKCYFSNDNSSDYAEVETVDGTACSKNGKCFRSRCIAKDYLLQNSDGISCMKAANRFESSDIVSVTQCPKPDQSTPFDRFSLRKKEGGYQIHTPYSSVTGDKNGDKCALPQGDKIYLFECTGDDNDQEKLWDVVTVDHDETFVKMRHQISGLCASLVDGQVLVSPSCDADDSQLLWELVE